jgi:hypothetical protein
VRADNLMRLSTPVVNWHDRNLDAGGLDLAWELRGERFRRGE